MVPGHVVNFGDSVVSLLTEIEQFDRSPRSLSCFHNATCEVLNELRNPSSPRSGPSASSIQAEHGPLQSHEADSLLLDVG